MKSENNVEKWMTCPKAETQYPGLAYVCPLDQLIVAEKLDSLHEIIGSKGIKYTIFNNEGEKVFLAVQEKRYREFDVKVFNNYGNQVIEMKRPFKLCINRVLVWAPPGNFVGSVKQMRSSCNTFIVRNRSKKTVLKITGQRSCALVYDVMLEDQKIGEVVQKGRLKEAVHANNFGVTFPVQMDTGEKAVLLGASFLIGYLKYRTNCCIPHVSCG